MPTRSTINFPRTLSDDEFEDLIRDLCAREWGDPHTQRFGRSGQSQMGVDVYGKPDGMNYRGAQCKLRSKDTLLTENKLNAEVKEAHQFPHKLDELIVVTDHPRDTNVQILVDKISERENKAGHFTVTPWFWENVTSRLAAYPDLMVKYYRDLFAALTNLPEADTLINIPLYILFLLGGNSEGSEHLDEQLRFLGITPLDKKLSINIQPDGFVGWFNDDNRSLDNLGRFVGDVLRNTASLDRSCPAFIILPPHVIAEFVPRLEDAGEATNRFQIIPNNLSLFEIAKDIFKAVFDYGYKRRGQLNTIDISFRTAEGTPNSLLDVNWQNQLSINQFPSENIWYTVFDPALTIVTSQLASLRSKRHTA